MLAVKILCMSLVVALQTLRELGWRLHSFQKVQSLFQELNYDNSLLVFKDRHSESWDPFLFQSAKPSSQRTCSQGLYFSLNCEGRSTNAMQRLDVIATFSSHQDSAISNCKRRNTLPFFLLTCIACCAVAHGCQQSVTFGRTRSIIDCTTIH